jgi:phage protein D
MPAMPSRKCVIRVDGRTFDDLHDDLIAVEVADRADDPSSFAIKLQLYQTQNSTWSRVDDSQGEANGAFIPWQRITILGGYGAQPDVLIDGYIAGVAPRYEPTASESSLVIWGYDASHAMDIEDKVVAWPDKKYSDIAAAIFGAYGLTPQVTDTQVIHRADDSLLIQRGTDWQFLRRLGQRIGFEVLIRGATGIFAPPDLASTPQKDLAIAFGDDTNLVWFEPRLVADLPSKVAMARTNAVDKLVETSAVEASPLTALGKRDGDALRSGRDLASHKAAAIAPADPTYDLGHMTAVLTGARRRSDWIVTAEGEIDGILYASPLRARNTVLVKGVGPTFAGLYYVTEVIHRFTPEAYTQRFKAVRNAVDLTGSEKPRTESATPVEVATAGRTVSPP